MENFGNYSHDTDGFIAAGTTVGMYPYMEEKAAEFNSRNRRQETEASGWIWKSDHPGDEFQLRSLASAETGRKWWYTYLFPRRSLCRRWDRGCGWGKCRKYAECTGNTGRFQYSSRWRCGSDTDAVANADAGDTSEEIHGADSTENTEDTEDTEDIQALREEIKDMIDELGTTWNNLYNQYNDRIFYAVMDPSGRIPAQNVNDPREIFSPYCSR